MKRLGILFALSVLCLAANAAVAQAADKYPSKPVKIIVPYAPGGATDIVARILADQLGKNLGQSFYVENKPGAFGIIAIEDMARSPADGYTLMIGNVTTNAITPIIYPQKFKIDYANDVAPVTNVVDIPAFLLATTKNFAVKSVPDLIAVIEDYLKVHNDDPKPFVWTASIDSILEKVGRCKAVLETVH